MAGPEELRDGLVVAALLVLVEHHHGDGMARGLSLEDPAQHLYAIRLTAGSDQVRLARAPPVQVPLDGLQIEGQPRLHAVQHHANGGAMAFAEGDDAEGTAEGRGRVVEHERAFLSGYTLFLVSVRGRRLAFFP